MDDTGGVNSHGDAWPRLGERTYSALSSQLVRPLTSAPERAHAPRAKTAHNISTVAVTMLVAVRALAGIVVFYATVSEMRALALLLFLLACSTDALDGQLAKRFRATPAFGPYADAMADCLLILASFAAFVAEGIYHFWMLAVIVVMFMQFVLTSGLRRPVYDPLGKYYGVALFSAIAVTLLLPPPMVQTTIPLAVVGFTLASATSRSLFLPRQGRQERP